MTSKLPDSLTFDRAVARDLRAYMEGRGIPWDRQQDEDLAGAIADNLVEWCHEWGTADCDYELYDPENPDEVGCFRVSDEVRGWMRAMAELWPEFGIGGLSVSERRAVMDGE